MTDKQTKRKTVLKRDRHELKTSNPNGLVFYLLQTKNVSFFSLFPFFFSVATQAMNNVQHIWIMGPYILHMYVCTCKVVFFFCHICDYRMCDNLPLSFLYFHMRSSVQLSQYNHADRNIFVVIIYMKQDYLKECVNCVEIAMSVIRFFVPGQPKKVSFFVKRDRTLRFFVLCKDTCKVSKSSRSDF